LSKLGAKYEGQNVIFWNKELEARITWGWNGEDLKCVVHERQP